MPFRLGHDVTYCIVNDEVAFFDLKADKWFFLPPKTRDAFRALLFDPDKEESSPYLSPLISRGLLQVTPVSEATPFPQTFDIPAFGRQDLRLPKGSHAVALEAVIHQLKTVLCLRLRPLHVTIQRLRNRKAVGQLGSGAVCSSDQMAEILAGYLKAERIISRQDQCLRRSIGLMNLLLAHGFFPNLVIGVRLRPPSAHAWVQTGDLVLNDEVDHVLPFTPILVV